jgi:hypothetical protein
MRSVVRAPGAGSSPNTIGGPPPSSSRVLMPRFAIISISAAALRRMLTLSLATFGMARKRTSSPSTSGWCASTYARTGSTRCAASAAGSSAFRSASQGVGRFIGVSAGAEDGVGARVW